VRRAAPTSGRARWFAAAAARAPAAPGAATAPKQRRAAVVVVRRPAARPAGESTLAAPEQSLGTARSAHRRLGRPAGTPAPVSPHRSGAASDRAITLYRKRHSARVALPCAWRAPPGQPTGRQLGWVVHHNRLARHRQARCGGFTGQAGRTIAEVGPQKKSNFREAARRPGERPASGGWEDNLPGSPPRPQGPSGESAAPARKSIPCWRGGLPGRLCGRGRRQAADKILYQPAARQHYANPGSRPVLSPNDGTETPMRSSKERNRFISGVSRG
jgi:hypothetical protein